MHIGLRIFFGFFLIVGLAALITLRVFVQEVKPGVREAMEDTLVDTAQVLATLAADDMANGHIADGAFARQLGKLHERPVSANVWGIQKNAIGYRLYITDAHGIVRYDSSGSAVGQDYSRWNDVYRTLRGEYGARSTRSDPNDDGSTVMHVAAPIRRGDEIIGVLTIAKPNQTVAPFIARSQRKIMLYGALLMGGAMLIGVACTGWLVLGLRRLQRYARAIAAGERASMPLQGANELAELGRAVESMHRRLEDRQYVETYIHTLTHEMKSPLAAISGAAELLQEDMPVANRRRFAENIRRQAGRLEQMIRKLLALAEVEQKQRLSVHEPVALRPVLEQLVDDIEPRARQRGVSLRIDANGAADAADGADAVVVDGDPFLLRQALGNLLDNALDFAPPGSTIRIALERQPAGRAHVAVVRVADDGPGVPDYALSRVFERFYSLPRPDGQDRSTGLGLCFVREVAMLHRGQVALANRAEGGACATLTLPSAG
ncbi:MULTISPECIES: two-component system sensor histidine kinase CreC [Burkholderia]|uniref:histidine kinase n=1 Tax=Burkholderia anthinoferrum TaxID=3090833 RepID=A0ABU5WMC6_9BURK|nr:MULTISPECIES: two-component system sensor histidine kinase CreC [Burkholderia]MEB2506134.1 two-component system sensor histidine kinase CreC [Burkholderia anthinoferrum]MEB2531133.1 two-component system sensor histidine kinase CreC [Burkholderia anthinoferrum]MEB2564031.1 two-component system sensor histidine kinase CreC [Burkholderia anthinoferrum]MEB2580117.1 two-component system sensor histidine kinase CreC [Burkholderia anthinoferrum]KVN64858.1 histidine kinase [Burkholderia anthina]